MCVGKNRFIFVSSLFCGLLMWRSCSFLSVVLFFSLNLFSAHHYKPGCLRKMKPSSGLYDARIKESVVDVVSNSYIIYYRLFCSWMYVRNMESVFIIFFFSPPFSGVLCDSLCTTLHCTGIFVRNLALNHSRTQNTIRGLTLLHFVDVQGCFLYAQKFLFWIFFFCPQQLFYFLTFLKKVSQTFINISVVVIHNTKVQKEICVMDELKNLPICRWAVCSHLRLLWKKHLYKMIMYGCSIRP